jgi:hypothetical protein
MTNAASYSGPAVLGALIAIAMIASGCKIYELGEVDRTPYLLNENGQEKRLYAITIWSGISLLPAPGWTHVVLAEQIPRPSDRSTLARLAEETPSTRRLNPGPRTADLYAAAAPSTTTAQPAETRWIISSDPLILAFSPPNRNGPQPMNRVYRAAIVDGHLVLEDRFRLVSLADLDQPVHQINVVQNSVSPILHVAPGTTQPPKQTLLKSPTTLLQLLQDRPWLKG